MENLIKSHDENYKCYLEFCALIDSPSVTKMKSKVKFAVPIPRKSINSLRDIFAENREKN